MAAEGQALGTLITMAGEFYGKGWMLGTSGNLSVKLDDEPLVFAITGSGVDKGSMSISDLAVVPQEEQVRLLGGQPAVAKPSAEMPIHRAIYQKVSEARVILHVHTISSTLLSLATISSGQPPWSIDIQGFEMLKGWDIHWIGGELRSRIPVLPNTGDMEQLAEGFADLINGGLMAPMVLIAGHGLTVWGETAKEARNRLEIAEFLCQALWQQRLVSN